MLDGDGAAERMEVPVFPTVYTDNADQVNKMFKTSKAGVYIMQNTSGSGGGGGGVLF